jgi:hypothetical protein
MGLNEGHDFSVSWFKKLLLEPKLMIGRMKASRNGGEAERRAGAAAMRNLDLREYIEALISSGIFVQKLVAKVWRVFIPAPRARTK